MPQFEVRCNTERVLLVEADNEKAALQDAEQTDFSEWVSTDSRYEIEPLHFPPDVPVLEFSEIVDD